ncbi:MAG: IS256 family transposase [Acidimicrobiia bacterium]|nr:IS256 family transposase [Acidimicrobiia bacterium]
MSMDMLSWLRKQLEDADTDLLRQMVATFAESLMSADADTVCGAPYRESSPDRVNRRNGYRTRRWDTRVGSIDLRIPKLREGSYFHDWLLDARTRAERAFIAVVAEAYVRGVSTRRVEGLAKTLGITSLSKSQVSALASDLDVKLVDEFRNRPLDGGPYTYVWADALAIKVREGGRIVNVACLVAVGVNAEGHREILGTDITTTEDGAGWNQFLRDLVDRGLSGVQLVISDDHAGLVAAIESVLPGVSWQRCRTHYLWNLRGKVPAGAQEMVATMVRTIFAQPDPESVWAQHRRVVDQLAAAGFEAAADHLDAAGAEILTFTGFPKAHWRQIWSNNPQERLNKEIRRRTNVVGIFPTRGSIIRLVGAVLAEQHDEWAIARRYMSLDALAQARIRLIQTNQLPEEVTPTLEAATG